MLIHGVNIHKLPEGLTLKQEASGRPYGTVFIPNAHVADVLYAALMLFCGETSLQEGRLLEGAANVAREAGISRDFFPENA